MLRVSLFFLLLVAVAHGAFIRSPIPPSAMGHFISDKNEDGRGDLLTVCFLKPISGSYIKNFVDSLVLKYPDESFKPSRFVANASNLKPSKENSHCLNYELPKEKVAYGFSVIENDSYKVSATLFQKQAASVELLLQDSLPPVPLKVFLAKGSYGDTLKVLYSEPVRNTTLSGNLSLRSGDSQEIRQISYQAEQMQDSSLVLHLLLPKGSFEIFTPSDSVIFEASLVEDFFGNSSKPNRVPLLGVSPFRLLTIPQASFSPTDVRERPVFELDFKESGTPFPKNRLGVALDMGEEQFETRILDLLEKRNGKQASISNDKISVILEMNVFSHTGSYLTGSQAEIQGNDNRLEKGRRVFFFWNFMDGRRRYVGSGAYFVRIGLRVFYQGKLIYQERSADFNSWGVIRSE